MLEPVNLVPDVCMLIKMQFYFFLCLDSSVLEGFIYEFILLRMFKKITYIIV